MQSIRFFFTFTVKCARCTLIIKIIIITIVSFEKLLLKSNLSPSQYSSTLLSILLRLSVHLINE